MGKQRSSWREQSADRQAVRNEKSDDTPKTRGVANKRDTKRWCRGKSGVEHKLVVSSLTDAHKDYGMSTTFAGWYIRYCSKCGKEFAMYSPPLRGYPERKPKPAWLLEYLASKK